MHPSLSADLIHEGRKLMTYDTAEDALNNYVETNAWIGSGEQLPYYSNGMGVVAYINHFIDLFPEHLIFNIIRNRNDCAKSCHKTFGYDEVGAREVYKNNVPFVNSVLRDDSHNFEVYYDMLLDDPFGIVEQIYSIIGYCPEKEYINKVVSTKDKWKSANGRMQCGLRYKERVE